MSVNEEMWALLREMDPKLSECAPVEVELSVPTHISTGYHMNSRRPARNQSVPKALPADVKPLPGETRLKQWLDEQARRDGSRPTTIYARLTRGGYPGVTLRRVTSRCIFVKAA